MLTVFFLLNLGVVQDLTIELLQQSPFLSLSTALFDAVADLNSQNIYPTKVHLQEYLSKLYSHIKTPDLGTIHECLGRLIRERRLYHNGRGYFILYNENILNEVIAMKSYQLNTVHNDGTLQEFVMNSSSLTSSSQPQTDIDAMKSFDTPCYDDTKLRINGCCRDDILNASCNSSGSNSLLKSKERRTPLGSNEPEIHVSYPNKSSEMKEVNKIPMKVNTQNKGINSEKNDSFWRPKIKRSQSFSGYETDRSWKKAVSFALVGAPANNEIIHDGFQRTYSFGAGRKTSLRQPTVESKYCDDKENHIPDASVNSVAYLDLETSFVDDNLQDNFLVQNSPSHMIHCPDMQPVESKPVDVLNHYNDLGSCISLTAKMGMSTYMASDFFPPEKAECLAEELKQAVSYANDETLDIYNPEISHELLSPRSRKNVGGDAQFVHDQLIMDRENKHTRDVFTSTRIEEGGDVRGRPQSSPNNSSKKACKMIESKKFDSKNIQVKESTKRHGEIPQTNNEPPNRSRSRVKEEKRRKTQKERNSLMFEEKRSSLKVMGMV